MLLDISNRGAFRTDISRTSAIVPGEVQSAFFEMAENEVFLSLLPSAAGISIVP
jgi:hypothetical protein